MHTCSVHSVTVSKSFGVQRAAAQPVKLALTRQGSHWSEAVREREREREECVCVYTPVCMYGCVLEMIFRGGGGGGGGYQVIMKFGAVMVNIAPYPHFPYQKMKPLSLWLGGLGLQL